MDGNSNSNWSSLLISAIFIAWVFDWPPVSTGEVTTYHAVCLERRDCKPKEMLAYRETYRADKPTLTVTSWQDLENTTLSLYRDCIIRDKKNWYCGAPIQMRDGLVQSTDEVTWYKYWWIRFLKFAS